MLKVNPRIQDQRNLPRIRLAKAEQNVAEADQRSHRVEIENLSPRI